MSMRVGSESVERPMSIGRDNRCVISYTIRGPLLYESSPQPLLPMYILL